MPVYVMAKAGREFLDTPVFHAGASGSEEAIAVFTGRDSADQYINEAGWSDHEVGEMTSLQLLQWMVKADGDGTRLLSPARRHSTENDIAPLYLQRACRIIGYVEQTYSNKNLDPCLAMKLMFRTTR